MYPTAVAIIDLMTQVKRTLPMNDKPGQGAGSSKHQKGGIGYVLLWLLGVPIPVLILIALLRGCA